MDFQPFILAGGSGTRFWPRSRKKNPKQLLSLDGERSMLQQTVERLLPLAPADRCWIITNEALVPAIAEQLPQIPAAHLLAEPVARNTAPAAGLAAFLLERDTPDTVIGLFPADHVVQDAVAFEKTLRAGCRLAAAGENIVVLGIKPSRPETGYGYIETGDALDAETFRVRRFTEKPNLERAEEFVAATNYFWNSGIFLATARTLANAMREHMQETAPYLEKIAAAFGTEQYAATLAEFYPQCENISIDYAVLEPRSAKGEHHSNLFCLPADFGWNDLGSWGALYDHKLAQSSNEDAGKNVIEAPAYRVFESEGNYVHTSGKYVALVGVKDLVIVETDDVLLITTRDACQNVGKLVKELHQQKEEKLI